MKTIQSYPYEVQERAAIMEYDGKLPREVAEAKAILSVENKSLRTYAPQERERKGEG